MGLPLFEGGGLEAGGKLGKLVVVLGANQAASALASLGALRVGVESLARVAFIAEIRTPSIKRGIGVHSITANARENFGG